MRRRTFVSTGLAALATGVVTRPARTRPNHGMAATIGIQLYTVRRLMSQDAARTLGALAQIGYREVELAGLYGHKPADFRKLLDAAGLVAPAAHIGLPPIRSNPSQVLDDAVTLGLHWVIVPSLDAAERTPDGVRRVADALNAAGELARQRGLRMGYHNHEYEFRAQGGDVPYDILVQNTDPGLVDFELDLFWIRRSGGDALTYFKRFPGRFMGLHVKDMTTDGRMVDVGQGAIDFAGIFAHADGAGVKHYFVEHDEPADPIQSAGVSFQAVQRLLRTE